MTRYQSRKISRNRLKVQALSPCTTFSVNGGHNPFAYLFQKLFNQEGETPEEKKIKHELKMKADQKSAKARQNRKRNKV